MRSDSHLWGGAVWMICFGRERVERQQHHRTRGPSSGESPGPGWVGGAGRKGGQEGVSAHLPDWVELDTRGHADVTVSHAHSENHSRSPHTHTDTPTQTHPHLHHTHTLSSKLHSQLKSPPRQSNHLKNTAHTHTYNTKYINTIMYLLYLCNNS